MFIQEFKPNTIIQVNDPNVNMITWDNVEYIKSDDNYAGSSQSLYTISGLYQEKYRSVTNMVYATNFNIPSDSNRKLSKIELLINVRREARIQDYIIQLTLNNELIGDNLAFTLSNHQAFISNIPVMQDYSIYGSSTELWNTDLSWENITDSSFGVVVSFQSNEEIPHRNVIYANQLRLRITSDKY